MAQKDEAIDEPGSTALEEADLDELARTLEQNEEELAELLEQLAVVQQLSADLAPELQKTAQENREPIREVRVALEREETLVLLQRVGENAETLTELLETLEVVDDLVDDLVPELQTVVYENRETVERLRFALEREELIVLLERLGENADTFVELVELLDVTHDLAEDVVPELTDVATENREPIRNLRMVIAGITDGYAGSEIDCYDLGQNLGHMLALGQRLGDPELIDAVDSGLGAFTEEEPPKKVGLFGLLGALFDDDVRQGLGILVEFLRRMGASKSE
ncbi:DUF1641 domain-containing protein [Natribaculum luteum]|uniref:DUF1641 domain-containing protein n=1 Tax=Natribaculum luteum TaxID=1586232 RepID=A0ABD5P1R7_9EURY|nr:DUF1641 domain-containing protein [Natribaculum luteum]